MRNEEEKQEEKQEEPTVMETIKNTPEEIKEFWLMIFLLLNKSERFVKFIEDNFEIEKGIDDEKQVVDVRVTEKEPPQEEPPQISLGPQEQIQIHSLLSRAGCNKPASTAQELVKILNGKEENTIVGASESDLEKWKKEN